MRCRVTINLRFFSARSLDSAREAAMIIHVSHISTRGAPTPRRKNRGYIVIDG